MSRRPRLNPAQQLQLAASALVDVRSIRKAYEGQDLRRLTRERILRAAEALGFPPPPPCTTTA